jgi:hypothetical protein
MSCRPHLACWAPAGTLSNLPGLWVVHACWHEPSRAALGPHLDASQCFTNDGLREALRRGSEAFAAADILMKGPEQRLPHGMTFTDQSGHERREVRVRWWDPEATTFKQAAIGIDDMLDELPDLELPTDFRYLEDTPVLFGHYWMPGEPRITFPTVACLDFSVARTDVVPKKCAPATISFRECLHGVHVC